jgi:hypothetical protein
VSEIVGGGFVPAEGSVRIEMMQAKEQNRTVSFSTQISFAHL